MNEEHRLEPNGGFKMVLAVITAAHLLMLGGFLTLSLHPLKRINQERIDQGRMDQERMDQELVWVNPGSFTGDAPGKTDGAPAVRAAPSTPSPPLVGGDEPPPDAAPVTTPAGPEEAPPSAPTPAPVEPVPPPEETPPPLPPLPARSDLGLATPNPPPMPKPVSKSRPKPIPSVTPKPKPSANATPKPKPKPSPSAIPKARTTPKPKPSPKPVPEASPETAANPKPPSRPKAGLMAKNGDKAPRADRVDDGDGGTVGSPGGAGAGQAAGNGESKLAYYAEVIKNRFQAAWNQPRGEIAAGTELVATVRLRIQPDGAVTEFALIEGSGNSVVDESVREAGRKITHLPPPPGGNGFNPVVRFELGD